MNGPGWTIRVIVPPDVVSGMIAAVEPFATAVSYFEIEGSNRWTIDAFCTAMPNKAALTVAVAVAARAAEIPEPEITCAPLPDIDWLAENRRSFTPIRIGRIFVHPSHYDGAIPAGVKPVRLDAATAFGSGDHETTQGCLHALGMLAGRGDRPLRVLDLGCGSGILSIAAAKLWPCQVVAADVDPEAVRVARENVRTNGTRGRVTVIESDGVSSGRVRREGPFDLVFANILAGPLIELAPGLSRLVARPGRLVLSGLLTHQQAPVLAAYGRAGLVPKSRYRFGEWPTMLLVKPAAIPRERD